MTVSFQFPYQIAVDTPAVAAEVQENLDYLLAWIQANYVQIDDSPGFSVNLEAPSTSGTDTQVVQKAYVDSVLPTGTVLGWAGSSLPDADEWEWCRGSNQSITDPKYAALYAIIGVEYGDPGGGNFTLPDFQSKFPLGVEVGTIDLGDTGGSTNVAQHSHTATFAGSPLASHGHADTFATNTTGSGHDHTIGGTGSNNQVFGGSTVITDEADTVAAPDVSGSLWRVGEATTDSGGQHTHNITGSVTDASAGTPAGTVTVDNDGDANDNRPPWQALNYIIKL